MATVEEEQKKVTEANRRILVGEDKYRIRLERILQLLINHGFSESVTDKADCLFKAEDGLKRLKKE